MRRTLHTSQGLASVVLEVSSGDVEAVLYAYLLNDGTVISVVYAFPSTWSEAGKDLAYRSFDTLRVH